MAMNTVSIIVRKLSPPVNNLVKTYTSIPRITPAASKISQIEENIAALDNLAFSEDELAEIDRWASEADLNIWSASSTAG